MPIRQSIQHFFDEHELAPHHLLVAVSGGADSTALLLALHDLDGRRFELTAVHVNHHLRGDAAFADQAFVERLCEQQKIPLRVVSGSVDPELVRRIGVEAAARKLRYDLLERSADELRADYIATAHNRNDQAETLLMRLVTGSGTTRLRGIRPVRGRVIRPILDVPRSAVESFLAERAIEPCADLMNADPRYLRSRIRHDVLPLLRELNPRVDAALAETARLAAELAGELDEVLDDFKAAAVREENETTVIATNAFRGRPWLFRRMILDALHGFDVEARELSSTDLRRIATLADGYRISVAPDVFARREGDRLILETASPPPLPFAFDVDPGRDASFPDGSLFRLETVSALPPRGEWSSPAHQLFEIEEEGPLHFTVRSRTPGDRFHPLGSPGEKKLKDFLINRKISRVDRDTLPLLTCNGRIIWIPGVEVSETFRIRDGRGRLFKATCERRTGDAEALQPGADCGSDSGAGRRDPA